MKGSITFSSRISCAWSHVRGGPVSLKTDFDTSHQRYPAGSEDQYSRQAYNMSREMPSQSDNNAPG
jgi:hypothetical protein